MPRVEDCACSTWAPSMFYYYHLSGRLFVRQGPRPRPTILLSRARVTTSKHHDSWFWNFELLERGDVDLGFGCQKALRLGTEFPKAVSFLVALCSSVCILDSVQCSCGRSGSVGKVI